VPSVLLNAVFIVLATVRKEVKLGVQLEAAVYMVQKFYVTCFMIRRRWAYHPDRSGILQIPPIPS
jgi:hypothetical protein